MVIWSQVRSFSSKIHPKLHPNEQKTELSYEATHWEWGQFIDAPNWCIGSNAYYRHLNNLKKKTKQFKQYFYIMGATRLHYYISLYHLNIYREFTT